MIEKVLNFDFLNKLINDVFLLNHLLINNFNGEKHAGLFMSDNSYIAELAFAKVSPNLKV